MNHWLEDLARAQSRGQMAIAVAVASTKGSVPREAGTRMLVTSQGTFGTIGGGHLEWKAIEIANQMLSSGGAPSMKRFPLGASLGQCCGGLVNLLFEPVMPNADWVDAALAFYRRAENYIVVTSTRGNIVGGKLLVTANEFVGSLGDEMRDRDAKSISRKRLVANQASTILSVSGEELFFEYLPAANFNVVLFGAGHVGRAVVKILADLPCNVSWIDSREQPFPVQIPHGVETRINDIPAEEVANARAGSYFLVMTHNHQLDQEICEAIFKRTDFAYFGLIGSMSKRRQFERRLQAHGIPAPRLAEMTCPIGEGGANDPTCKQPMAIAVSVVMELLQRRSVFEYAHRQTNSGRDALCETPFQRQTPA